MLGLSQADFKVYEDGIERKILYIDCPEKHIDISSSIAMSIDISGSMSYNFSGVYPVELGKTTAKTLVESIPMPPSEFALQTCDSRAMIIQDFTKNKELILSAIPPIRATGGNDFGQQLLNSKYGLLNIAKRGAYAKAAIIFTDAYWQALPDGQLQECIDICNNNNIKFFSIFYSHPDAKPDGIKKTLQTLCEKTNGKWYDGVLTEQYAEDIADEIKNIASAGEFCTIEWESGLRCSEGLTKASINLGVINESFQIKYTPPESSIAKLEVNPSYVFFLNKEPGVKHEQIITVSAYNHDFDITNIKALPQI